MRDEGVYLSIKDVATKLQVNQDTVRRWIREGKLHATYLGSKYRISQHDLQVFLKERRK
jgi:excisionase family DNA binding protein